MNTVEEVSSLAERLFDATRLWGGAMKTTPRESFADEQLEALKSFLAKETGADDWKKHQARVRSNSREEVKAWRQLVHNPRSGTLRGAYQDAIKASMVEAVASLGGALVPTLYSNKVVGQLVGDSQLRAAGALQLPVEGANLFQVPTSTWSGSAPIATELAAGSQMEPVLGTQNFTPYAYRAAYIASREEMLDSRVPLDNFLMSSAGWQFVQSENNHFAIGTGSSQPQGIAVAASTISASPGSTAALAFATGADTVMNMYYSLPYPYRQHACWFAADATFQQIRKERTGGGGAASLGDYQWQAGLEEGAPDRLLGRPVYPLNTMASSGSVSNVLVFADPRFFCIADFNSGGTEFQYFTETYAVSGAVGWWFWRRVDSHLLVAESAVGLKLR
jgi:HK97 family phage major capsid protein